MRRICLLVILLYFAFSVTAQKTSLIIPEFKNVNPKDEYPVKSLIATYARDFDILISLRDYSNWVGVPQTATILAYKENGWYKIKMRDDYFFRDSSTAKILISKIDNIVGDTLWNICVSNHLFEMEDERTKRPTACSMAIFDADYHDFEIITAKEYKRIYFYAPGFYEEHCPAVPERKQLLNCLRAFEKHLGK